MITVKSFDSVEALVGCAGFEPGKLVRVHNQAKKNIKRKLISNILNVRLDQNMLIAKADAWTEQLSGIYCTAEITIGAKDGKAITQGEVACLEKDIEVASEIVQTLIAIADRFAQSHIESSFELRLSQVFEKCDH